MKLFKKFSLILLSMFIFAGSAFIFAGCGNDNKNCKLYIFSSIGGTVKVDNHDEVVEFGDEGSRIFTYKKNDVITLSAIPNAGYRFVKWKFTETKQDYSLIETKPNVELNIVDEELIVKAEFVLDGSITTYGVTYPNNPTGYTFTIQNGYSTPVVAGEEFKFKIELWENYSDSNIVVKANNQIVTADGNGVYTIIVNADTNITVSGVQLNEEDEPTPTMYRVYTTSPLFNIKFNGQVNIQNSWNVEEGQGFTFSIQIIDGYHAENLVVKAGGTVLTETNGVYTISSVVEDVQITAEGIVKDVDEPVLPNPTIYQVKSTSPLFKIVVNGQANAENTWNVEENKSFVFTLQLVDGYKFDDVVVVTANGVEVTLTNAQTYEYTINSVITNIEIEVSGIVEDVDMYQVYTNSPLFEIVADGETIAQDSWDVKEGEAFTFTIEIAEGYHAENLVIKADGYIVTETDGKYTILSVLKDMIITAEGIVEDAEIYQVKATSTLFKIVVDGQTNAENAWSVEEGQSFTFSIEIAEGYYAKNLVVKADGYVLTKTDGKYKILSVLKDIKITAEGIDEDTETTYIFALVFNDDVYTQVWLPESLEITVKESEKQSTYSSNELVFFDEFNEPYSIQDIAQIIDEGCSTLEMTGLTIGGLDFVVINGDTITVDWEVLNTTGSNYELVVKTKAI